MTPSSRQELHTPGHLHSARKPSRTCLCVCGSALPPAPRALGSPSVCGLPQRWRHQLPALKADHRSCFRAAGPAPSVSTGALQAASPSTPSTPSLISLSSNRSPHKLKEKQGGKGVCQIGQGRRLTGCTGPLAGVLFLVTRSQPAVKAFQIKPGMGEG